MDENVFPNPLASHISFSQDQRTGKRKTEERFRTALPTDKNFEQRVIKVFIYNRSACCYQKCQKIVCHIRSYLNSCVEFENAVCYLILKQKNYFIKRVAMCADREITLQRRMNLKQRLKDQTEISSCAVE